MTEKFIDGDYWKLANMLYRPKRFIGKDATEGIRRSRQYTTWYGKEVPDAQTFKGENIWWNSQSKNIEENSIFCAKYPQRSEQDIKWCESQTKKWEYAARYRENDTICWSG